MNKTLVEIRRPEGAYVSWIGEDVSFHYYEDEEALYVTDENYPSPPIAYPSSSDMARLILMNDGWTLVELF